MGGGHTLAYHLNNKLQPFLKKDDVKGWTMGKKYDKYNSAAVKKY